MRRLPLAPTAATASLLLCVAAALALATGPVRMETGLLFRLASALFGQGADIDNQQHQWIMLELRLPRVLMATLVGAALGMSGTAIQGLFRNPLADPGLIGVSGGAALGAVSIIVLGQSTLAPLVLWLGHWALPLAAFGSGLLATLVVYRIARHGGNAQVATLLLAGIAINALTFALTGILTYAASDDQLRNITFWSMGSLSRANWREALTVLVFVVVPLALLPLQARALNALALGDDVAGHLGYSVTRLKRIVIVCSAMATGATVAFCGMVGFVGLIAPHILRLLLGPDHRALLPMTAVIGATLVIVADTVARTLLAPAELPIGLLMSLLGGPFFLAVLLARAQEGQH